MSATEESKKYYGHKVVVGASSDAEKKEVTLTYADGSEETVKTVLFETGVSDVPLDPTGLRHKQLCKITEDILKIIIENHVKICDVEYLLSLIKGSIDDTAHQANAHKWGTKSSRDVTVAQFHDEWTLAMAEQRAAQPASASGKEEIASPVHLAQGDCDLCTEKGFVEGGQAHGMMHHRVTADDIKMNEGALEAVGVKEGDIIGLPLDLEIKDEDSK